MGMSIYSEIGYGFVIYSSEGERDPIYDDIDWFAENIKLPCLMYKEDYYPFEYYIFEEAIYDEEGIKTFQIGTSDYYYTVVCIKESYQSSYWEPKILKVRDLEYKDGWNERLWRACDRFGLEHQNPDWIFGPYYSY
jgi:hypothetical protein